jgi:hypothetical protein
MFGNEIIEVGIGLAFVYLLLSLICTVVNEWIAGVLGSRARNLEAGISSLFSDGKLTIPATGNAPAVTKAIADAVYDHGLIQSLYRTDWLDKLLKRDGRPSYIPANLFALALVDTLAPADAGAPKSIAAVRSAVGNLPDGAAKQALMALVTQAGDDVAKARAAIESWYNSGMERVSGWYKRKTQLVLVCLALAVTLATNTDSVLVAKTLWQNPGLRASTAAAATEFAKNHAQDSNATSKTFGELRTDFAQLDLPVGWKQCPTGKDLPPHLLGWFLTMAAVSLGAPFWFDVLNKFMAVRSTTKPKEAESGTKDGGKQQG